MKKIRVFGLILAVMALIAFLASCSNPAGPRANRPGTSVDSNDDNCCPGINVHILQPITLGGQECPDAPDYLLISGHNTVNYQLELVNWTGDVVWSYEGSLANLQLDPVTGVIFGRFNPKFVPGPPVFQSFSFTIRADWVCAEGTPRYYQSHSVHIQPRCHTHGLFPGL